MNKLIMIAKEDGIVNQELMMLIVICGKHGVGIIIGKNTVLVLRNVEMEKLVQVKMVILKVAELQVIIMLVHHVVGINLVKF